MQFGAEVESTAFSLGFSELTAVGQTAAAWRFAQLQAVKQTSADSSRLTEDGKPQRLRAGENGVPKTRRGRFDSSDAPNIDRDSWDGQRYNDRLLAYSIGHPLPTDGTVHCSTALT